MYILSLIPSKVLIRPVTRGNRKRKAPLEKCVGHSFKILDIIQKI